MSAFRQVLTPTWEFIRGAAWIVTLALPLVVALAAGWVKHWLARRFMSRAELREKFVTPDRLAEAVTNLRGEMREMEMRLEAVHKETAVTITRASERVARSVDQLRDIVAQTNQRIAIAEREISMLDERGTAPVRELTPKVIQLIAEVQGLRRDLDRERRQ